MFGIGRDLFQQKGNIIAPIIFLQAKKNYRIVGELYNGAEYLVHIEGDP